MRIYWNEAPSDATHLDTVADLWCKEGSFWHAGGWIRADNLGDLGSNRYTPRPTDDGKPPEWDGKGRAPDGWFYTPRPVEPAASDWVDGWPPVGTECEYLRDNDVHQVIVIAYVFDEVVVFQKHVFPDYTGVQLGYLFPLGTHAWLEREDLIRIATQVLNRSSELTHPEASEALYDAGMLRMATR